MYYYRNVHLLCSLVLYSYVWTAWYLSTYPFFDDFIKIDNVFTMWCSIQTFFYFLSLKSHRLKQRKTRQINSVRKSFVKFGHGTNVFDDVCSLLQETKLSRNNLQSILLFKSTSCMIDRMAASVKHWGRKTNTTYILHALKRTTERERAHTNHMCLWINRLVSFYSNSLFRQWN